MTREGPLLRPRILLVDVPQMLKDLLLSAHPELCIAAVASARDDLARLVAEADVSLIVVGSGAGSAAVRRLLDERARLRAVVLGETDRTLVLHELSRTRRRVDDVSFADLGAFVDAEARQGGDR
jgi:hypothetical protein